MRQIGIGIAGFGTVGAGVYKHLSGNRRLLCERLGLELEVRKIALRDPAKARSVAAPKEIVTTRWEDLIEDPSVEIVVELMGGVEEPLKLVLAAIEKRKIVVTGNKALLAEHGREIFEAAGRHRVPIFFEAAVAGGVPIIKSIREAFVASHIRSIHGIINGTSNYILTRMTQAGLGFAEALKEAQDAGFAEADPTLDVEGHDAAHKIGILASLAHGFWVKPQSVHVEGIRSINKLDIQFAGQLGYTIKLLGIVKKIEDTPKSKGAKGRTPVQVSVYPTLIPNEHVLASVNHVFNAVYVRGDVVGDTLYYGRGAGQDATASAVLSDLADAALDLKCGSKSRIPPFVPHDCEGAVLPLEEIVSRYYVRLSVVDKPGTLAKIAAILGQAKIGISSVIQPEGHAGESVPLILMIHDAPNAAMNKALARISKLGVVKGQPLLLRVENFD